MNRTKLRMLAAILTLCGAQTSPAQETAEQFSIATLNVDGLPQKILVVNVNADGPGDAGTARIGKYLNNKGYDLLLMQEDFNYHQVLTVMLEDNYKLDEHTGNVEVLGHKIDYLHLQNHRFACDGLMTCWKNDLTVAPAARTPWQQNFGKFSHAMDEMVTKGFRRYDVTLRGGTRLVVYNLHMDATDDADEAEGNGGKDREARMAQLAQLREDVLRNLDSRPVVIAGDMNSFYGRDDVKRVFIDPINDSGRGTASDVWVELQRKGEYPAEETDTTDLSDIRNGESLDKILYINPVMGTKIQPLTFTIDIDGYQLEGKPLGDHYPVAATFLVAPNTAGIAEQTISRETQKEKYYDLKGQAVDQPRHGLYVRQQGEKTEKRVIK